MVAGKCLGCGSRTRPWPESGANTLLKNMDGINRPLTMEEEVHEDVGDPFARRSRLLRSPDELVPRQRAGTGSVGDGMTDDEVSLGVNERDGVSQETPLCPPKTGVDKGKRESPRQAFIYKVRNDEAQELSRCRDILKRMKKACEVQKNISQTVKNGILELEGALANIKSYRNSWQSAEKEILASVPVAAATAEKKRPAASPAEQGQMEPKKKKEEETGNDGQFIEVLGRKKKRVQRKGKQEDPAPAKDNLKPSVRKSVTKPAKNKKVRSNAILIKTSGSSFADVLKKIQKDVRPEDTGTEIKSVRKTQAGGVLIEIGEDSKNKSGFREAIEGALGEGAVVSSLEPKVTLEIMDIPESYEDADVREALQRDAPELGSCKVGLTTPNPRGLKVGIFTVGEKAAEKLLDAGKLRIGWVICRVRVRTTVVRCFKCLGFGHLASKCSGPDRRAACFRCGESGHKGKECTAAECCIVCKTGNVQDTGHKLGSGRCKTFRDALAKAKQSKK